ncbi:MAG: M1 family metallopeptidase, partial [Saprospiraceae bacterium]
MKNNLLLCSLLFFSPFLFGQNKPYFQQQVDYNIRVVLDDENHTLTGTVEMVYTNNSPDELSEIYIHLWANAFKNNNTAFARQKLRTGSTRFYFSSAEDRGYYGGLDFTIDGQKAAWRLKAENPDIAVVTLPQPLESGGKVTIRTPFTEKIPASFSRLGHVGTSYQMTQWYPKPAVYDRKGWHPIPYLDMGEFYSEFGSFDVSITLPENYVVGATGVLQTESERIFLMKKVEETKGYMEKGFPTDTSFPASSSTMKTIRYTAENVHDFAWFADKRFHVQRGEVTLASGQKVDTWTMFTNEQADLWRESINYVGRAVEFYSKHIGEYPWPHATAVHSALSAGGGMEYPMITVIGNAGGAKDLDQVITHE